MYSTYNPLSLHGQLEAEAGSAEEQPARNITDYLSIA